MAEAAFDAQAFDTSVRGAPEAEWAAWADATPLWTPQAGRIVVVAPHPDDETLGAGGLISVWSGSGFKVTLISVTDGEGACPEIPNLAQVRADELVGAMHEFGAANADRVRLKMPDGGVAARQAELTEIIVDHLAEGATLVAPFEFDGHPDHDAAGRASRTAARIVGIPLARYPIWAWHRGSVELRAERDVRRFVLTARAHGAKQRALAEFRSQLNERPGGAIVPPHVLEYFARPYELFLL